MALVSSDKSSRRIVNAVEIGDTADEFVKVVINVTNGVSLLLQRHGSDTSQEGSTG
jgi:hypothetical protein